MKLVLESLRAKNAQSGCDRSLSHDYLVAHSYVRTMYFTSLCPAMNRLTLDSREMYVSNKQSSYQ